VITATRLHPDGTGTLRRHREGPPFAHDNARRAEHDGRLTWRHLLDETVADLYAETEPDQIHTRLGHVAVIIQAWRDDIDQATATPAAQFGRGGCLWTDCDYDDGTWRHSAVCDTVHATREG
jgi:hypothetical protein